MREKQINSPNNDYALARKVSFCLFVFFFQVKLDASIQAAENSGIAETKYADLVEKYSKLCEEHQKLVSTNKDLFQVNVKFILAVGRVSQ